MRIAVAGQAFFREDNGQAAFTVRLVKGLAEAGHQLYVFAPSEKGKATQEDYDNFTLYKVPALHLAHNANVSFNAGHTAHRVLADFIPDIIHIQDHYFLCRTVGRHARKFNIPIVGTNHFLPSNLTDNFRIPNWMVGLSHALLWRHMLSLYNRLQAVSTPTETAAAILKEQKIIPPVTAISCGVDTDRFRPLHENRRAEVRLRYGIDTEADAFIYVGRIDREKGLETMVEAFHRLDRGNVQFLICGKGSFRKDLEKMVHKLHLENNVLFPGFIPAEDLPLLIGACDCFVMAGHAELQSIATMEAMACGLPVIAANAAALPELVKPGINGELFSPHDAQNTKVALQRILEAKKKWTDMGKQSRKSAEQHPLEQTVNEYIAWYCSAIETS